jgi:hypothetical protein
MGMTEQWKLSSYTSFIANVHNDYLKAVGGKTPTQ